MKLAGRGGASRRAPRKPRRNSRRIARAARPVLLDPRHELVGRGNAARERRTRAARSPSASGEAPGAAPRRAARSRRRRSGRRGASRGSRYELLEPDRLVLEVDLLDVRPGREAAPVRGHDLESVGERFLGAPGQVRVDDGTVNEQEARLAIHAGFGCHKVPAVRSAPADTAILARGCRGPPRRRSAPLEPVAFS